MHTCVHAWAEEKRIYLVRSEASLRCVFLQGRQQLSIGRCCHWAGQYHKALKGIHSSPPAGGVTPEAFLSMENIKAEWQGVEKAYTEERGLQAAKVEAEGDASLKTEPQAPEDDAGAKDTKVQFLQDCKSRVADFLSQHLICVHGFEGTIGALLVVRIGCLCAFPTQQNDSGPCHCTRGGRCGACAAPGSAG